MGQSSVILSGVTPEVTLPEYWSPSRLSDLQACGLRVALSLDTSLKQQYERGNTYAAMGTAAHKLTQMAWSGHFDKAPESDLKSAISGEWDRLIADEHARLAGEWQPAQVPAPRDWPFFARRKVKTVSRVAEEVRTRLARGKGAISGSVRIEKMIADADRRLRGIPDRVILTGEGFFVLDLKTGGSVTEVSETHRRQLLLYAHLVSQTTDEPVLAIGVVAAGGETFWADASKSDVEKVVQEAIKEIADFEARVMQQNLGSLAQPSPEACRFCPFKNVCRSYWENETHEWLDYRGVLGNVVRVIDERAFVIEQIYPSHGRGRTIGVSNTHHDLNVGDVASVADGFLRNLGLRGSWYTRTVALDSKQVEQLQPI